MSGKLNTCTNSGYQVLLFPAHQEPGYEAKQLQSKPTMYCTGTATPVESVHNHCCSTSVHLLTWRAGLTLAREGCGSLAKLQPIHEHLHLRSSCHWGCEMSENKRWEVVQQISSLCVNSVPHHWDTVSDTTVTTHCLTSRTEWLDSL